MKATFDLPDQLYRDVKAKTAQEGRTVREVVVALFQQWIANGKTLGASTPPVDWNSHRPPLGHLVSGETADHSMGAVRESIEEKWDEPR